jgi:sigma-B regulation protein RsbU (phosphoserine phosphatase)
MTSKPVLDSQPPIGTTQLAFIVGFWPVLLVYAVGPIGDIIMGGGWVSDPAYPIMLAGSLAVVIALFVVAGLWAYRPLALLIRGSLLTDPPSIEAAVHALPYRVGKAFLLSGLLFATIGVVLLTVSSLGPAGRPPAQFIVGAALVNYYAYGLVMTVLGVSRTLYFTTRLRKALSEQGVFTGNLHANPYSSTMISVTKRPWQLFIVTSVLPFLLMGILFMIARGLDDPHHQRTVFTAIFQMFLGVLICGSYLVYTMRRTMKLVLDELGGGMDSIQQGQYSKRVAVLLDDETGNMARSLNTALEGLQERNDLRDALSIAAEIQSGLLPKAPLVPPGFTLQTFHQSCYDVGGDYYDIIELEDGRLWLVVADVSGKGYSAALTVANLHAILHTLASSGQGFEQVPGITNSAMSNILTRGRFVTVFMAELTPGSDSMHWFNAGHTAPVLASSGRTILLESTGLPLGVLPELSVPAREQTLSGGDLLAVFTDGVTELRSGKVATDLFGMKRTQEWVSTHRDTNNGKLPEEFLKELAGFGKPARDDDLTMLFLQREH